MPSIWNIKRTDAAKQAAQQQARLLSQWPAEQALPGGDNLPSFANGQTLFADNRRCSGQCPWLGRAQWQRRADRAEVITRCDIARRHRPVPSQMMYSDRALAMRWWSPC